MTDPSPPFLLNSFYAHLSLGTRIAPNQVCRMLHELFSAFDELSIVHDVYKIGARPTGVFPFLFKF